MVRSRIPLSIDAYHSNFLYLLFFIVVSLRYLLKNLVIHKTRATQLARLKYGEAALRIFLYVTFLEMVICWEMCMNFFANVAGFALIEAEHVRISRNGFVFYYLV